MEGTVLTEFQAYVTSPSYPTNSISIETTLRNYHSLEIYGTASLSASNNFQLKGEQITSMIDPTVKVAYGVTFQTDGV